MRIFYASAESPFAGISSQIWRNNLYQTLVDMGHEVFEFTYDHMAETFRHLDASNPESRRFIAENRPRLSAELFRQISELHRLTPIKLFFSYFYDSCIEPETLEKIKALGIVTINWYCNASYQLHLVSEISPHYDYCLVPEKFRLKDYQNMGARPLYCQEAANPSIYRPYDLPQEFDVVFIGQAYGDRPDNLKFLREQGIDARAWGPGWRQFSHAPRVVAARNFKRLLHLGKRMTHVITGQEKMKNILQTIKQWGQQPSFADEIVGPPLSDIEMIKMYSRARINIGFSSCGETSRQKERILQIRLRDFEIPMSGGFYMIEYMEDLEEFFEIGKELVCYKDLADLAEKIKYYLAHPEERELIRQAGYQRCLRDHTWQKRFEMVFHKTGLSS